MPNMQNQSPDVGTHVPAQDPATASPVPVRTSTVIRWAAERLARDGWCQGDYARDGRVCAQMAVIEASSELGAKEGAYLDALTYMRKFIGAQSLPLWNDSFATAYEDVQALFKNAADLAESKCD